MFGGITSTSPQVFRTDMYALQLTAKQIARKINLTTT
jgi:hypothetical protein